MYRSYKFWEPLITKLESCQCFFELLKFSARNWHCLGYGLNFPDFYVYFLEPAA